MSSDNRLTLQGCIGFSGAVPHALVAHPDKEHLVYPLGCNVVVEKISGKKAQTFLQGHNDFVSCIAVSPNGTYVASGQQTHMGFQADIIIWDFQTRKELKRLSLHRVKVQALSFSPDEKYIVSLGGEDDGKVSFWDIESGKALCSSTTGDGRGGFAETIAFCKVKNDTFVTGGNETLRVWKFNPQISKMTPQNITVRGLRRWVVSIVLDNDDETAYCGTKSGDILCVKLTNAVLNSIGPKSTKFERGVTALELTAAGMLIATAGDGTVGLVNPATWKVIKTSKLEGPVTSVTLRGDGQQFFVGTSSPANIYRFALDDWSYIQRSVSHSSSINDVQFPAQTHELFGTCAGSEIRIWHTATVRELLRITVPNLVCHALAFTPNGAAIMSGWNDGTIRCYRPESGTILFDIPNANGKGVTALAPTNDNTRLLTGGGDGQVRLWRLSESTELVRTMKEHTGEVTSIMVNSEDTECVSSSVDGSCIVWNLNKFVRQQIIMANTLFKQVRYRPDEAQVLTVGTDRKVGYWEVFDGTLIREMEINPTGPINAVDIAADGQHFASGGSDKLVKVFSYRGGNRTHVGEGHSGAINRLVIDDGMHNIVSVSSDGAILIWEYPAELCSE